MITPQPQSRGEASSAWLALFLIVLFILITISAAFSFWLRFQTTTAIAQTRYAQISKSLSPRIDRRQSQEPPDLVVLRVMGTLSTTGRLASDTNESNVEIEEGKGVYLSHELVVPADTSIHRFRISPGRVGARIVDAWVSHAWPLDRLAAFQQFHTIPDGTNGLELIVQLKPDAHAQMHFDLSVALQKLVLN